MKGDSTGLAEGVVIESKVSKEFGNVGTVIVKRGTLRPGSFIIAGDSWAKVKRMTDENGLVVECAGPSCAVQVSGWKTLPNAGDILLQGESEALVKKTVENRKRKNHSFDSVKNIDAINEKRITAKENLLESKKYINKTFKNSDKPVDIQEKIYKVILKGDVDGSIEAIENALMALPSHEVSCKIVSSLVGNLNLSDINLAAAASADIITFNIPESHKMTLLAKSLNVKIHQFSIIYNLIDLVKEKMSEYLEPERIISVTGEASVAQKFTISVKKSTETVFGCRVLTGKITKSDPVRIVRNGKVLGEDDIKTFKNHKKDITEAPKGLEFGLGLQKFIHVREGDLIQSISVTYKKRTIQ